MRSEKTFVDTLQTCCVVFIGCSLTAGVLEKGEAGDLPFTPTYWGRGDEEIEVVI